MKVPVSASHNDQVLAKALLSLQAKLQLNQTELGQIIGKDRSTISRLDRKPSLDPQSKSGELALLFIACYRSLFGLMGGDESSILHWLTTQNLHLNGVPIELMQSVEGLVRCYHYLNAMRGKV